MNKIFLYLLPLSLKACVVIPLVMFVRYAMGRQPKIYSYVMWLLVFVLLVADIRIDTPFAIYNPVGNITNAVSTEYAEIMDDYVDDVHIYHDNRLEYYTAVENGIVPVYNPEDGTRYVVTSQGTFTPPATFASHTVPKLAFVWAAGVLVLLWRILKSYIAFTAPFEIKEKQGRTVYADGIPSPFVYGVLKPVIYIPYNMKDNPLQSVILHETIHISRGDHIVKPLCLFISVLHWYNPFVWLAFRLLCTDMEMSCDEAVVARTGNKKEYSLQLLTCAAEKTPQYSATVLFGESGAENRIKNVLAYHKPTKAVSVLLVAMLAVLSTACMVQQKVEEIIPEYTPTFYEQLSQLNSTEDVQYKERELIESAQGIRNTGVFRADEMYVKTAMPAEVTPASIGKYGLGYNGLTGTTTKTEDGAFSSFAYVLKNSEKLYLCTATEADYNVTTLDMPQGHSLLCEATGREVLADNLEFLSYYTKDSNDQLWLNIHKIKDGKTEIYQHKMSNDNAFILRGLRFINENVGFMGQTERGRCSTPQASITVDGGKTWYKLDFSQLTAPQYFTNYYACCMVVMDNMIEIRYFSEISQSAKDKLQNISDISTSAENYSIISEDGGLTWTGYLRVRDTQRGRGYTHQKVTDTVPVMLCD